MAFRIICKQCKQEFVGKDEYEAEVLANNHKCTVNYDSLSGDELRKLTYADAEPDRKLQKGDRIHIREDAVEIDPHWRGKDGIYRGKSSLAPYQSINVDGGLIIAMPDEIERI